MDFCRLENAICDINKLHKEISSTYLNDDSFNLKSICVKDVVENSSKISKDFLDYIDGYYIGLNAALILNMIIQNGTDVLELSKKSQS